MLNIVWTEKQSRVSGEKNCSTVTTTTTSTTTTTTTTTTSTSTNTTGTTSTSAGQVLTPQFEFDVSPYSTNTSTTTTTTTATTITTAPEQKCQEGEVPKQLKVFQKIKKIQTWPECRDLCDDTERCEYFNWKVNFKILNI